MPILSLSDCIELDNIGDILYDIKLYWGVPVDDGNTYFDVHSESSKNDLRDEDTDIGGENANANVAIQQQQQ